MLKVGEAPESIARTLSQGRLYGKHRELLLWNGEDPATPLSKAPAPAKEERGPTVFLFPGQGAQSVGMGIELYRSESTYRRWMDETCSILQRILGLDLLKIIHEGEGQLSDTALAQPALFAVEHALACWVMELGIEPDLMLGHSVGEVTAACIAGVFSLEDACRLVGERGRLMQSCERGSMATVFADASDVQYILPPGTDLAADNAPGLCVVSGPDHLIDEFLQDLEEEGIQSRRLKTSHAFHSSMMDPVLPQFTEIVESMTLSVPQLKVALATSGTSSDSNTLTQPMHWIRHLREKVNFRAAVDRLLMGPRLLFIELGPRRSLSELVRQHDKTLTCFSILDDDGSGREQLSNWWRHGVNLDLMKLNALKSGPMVHLPVMPFQGSELPQIPLESPVVERAPLEHHELSWRKAQLEAIDVTSTPWVVMGSGGPLQQLVVEEIGKLHGQPILVENLQSLPQLPSPLNLIDLRSVNLEGDIEHTRQKGFQDVMDLGLALERQNLKAKIVVVVPGLADLDGSQCNPLNAMVLGPCRVLPQEFPDLHVQAVDVLQDESDLSSITSALV